MARKPEYTLKYIESVIEYRRTHSLIHTAKKYNIPMATIRYWLKQRGVKPEPVKKLTPVRVRVLKKVPEGFEAPQRRLGW